jgi:lipopolysaccharide export LptBFGC system permease protein LptF
MRENRELLVLFSAGTGPYQLLTVTLAVAIAAMALSLTISGVIDPSTRFAERSILFNAEFRALRNGINTGQFYRFPNRVAFAPARAKNAGHQRTSSLFVYEQMKPEGFRVVTADHALLEGPDEDGSLQLKLGGLTSHTFKSVHEPGGQVTKDVSQSTLAAGNLTQKMGEDELLSLQPRGSLAEEMSVFDQLAGGSDLKARHREDMRLLGERFARGLLCLLAPLLALSAICFTTRVSNYFVLPLACMALMTLNLASGWMIKAIVPLTPLWALSIPAGVSAILAAVLLCHIISTQGRLAHPQLARP